MAVKKKQTSQKTKKANTKAGKEFARPDESFLELSRRFFNDGRTKFLIAAICGFFAIYLFMAFTSYLLNWQSDQSEFTSSSYVSDPDVQVENTSGKLGASIANVFLYKWFGIASYSVVFILLLLGLHQINFKPLPLKKSIIYAVSGTLWLSVTLSFIAGPSYQILGGAHGYYISSLIKSLMGGFGTGFLLLIILVAFILFTFKSTYDWVYNKLGSNFSKLIKNPQEQESVDEEEETDEQEDNITVSEKLDTSELFKGGNIDLDTNEILDPVERKKIILLDNGKEIDKNKLDKNEIELEKVIPEIEFAEEINEEQTGLLFDVEKNQDIELDEIIDESEFYDPTLDLSNYKFPPLDLLDDHRSSDSIVTNQELIENKNKIVETLRNYKIEITKIKATIGPTITLYEIVPAPGVRISKIKNLEDDIALSLSALGIRIIAPMPGRGTIGIEVPNQKPEIVSMRSVISSLKFQESKHELPIALGKTISNESYVVDLTKMPHLLVAGATGQGKSVGLNAIITSLLYKKHPSQLKFIFVDPKKVELSLYEKIEKHFLAKLPESEEAIITQNSVVIHTLNSLNKEMDTRYDLLKLAKVRNIKEYNEKFTNRRLNPNRGHRFLPYLVLVIDEFADLIITAGKEIEMPIARLAQLARAVGIHLIIATQRPSTNIITGVIKANFPTRMAFKVASMIDSRTILDSPGANQLIGRGDMLITEGSELIRLQCAYIDTPELDKITDFIYGQQSYPSAFMLPEPDSEEGEGAMEVDMSKLDELFTDAARIVVIHQQGSTSLIQRKLSIGYNRAGRIIDQLEAAGIVGPFEGSKAREVLITDEYSLEQFLKNFRVN
jgi:S-DNA-T family DNA segregation ATPase FtsK/SpoIIIE